MITTKVPNDWRELQSQTALILSECGFNVEEEKILELARGKKEIDVYAEELVDGRKRIHLCECKYWKDNLPQEVVHAFRTVLGDSGADTGYIISRVGFQSGAINASKFTPIKLVTWEDFIDEFETTWIRQCFFPMMDSSFNTLIAYTDTFNYFLLDEYNQIPANLLHAWRKKYHPFAAYILNFTKAGQFVEERLPVLPLSKVLASEAEDFFSSDMLDAVGLKELLDAALDFRDLAFEELHKIIST